MSLSEKIRDLVKSEAKKQGIEGVMAMASHCGLSYEKTVRVWKGYGSAKIVDAERVLLSLGVKDMLLNIGD